MIKGGQRIAALVQCLLWLLPWPLRRRALGRLFGFRIHVTARVGFSVILADEATLGAEARIGHLTLIKDLQTLAMGDHAILGSLNWIYAIPPDTPFFRGIERRRELNLAYAASVTGRHIIDCSDRVDVGSFALVAGYRTQILTHSVHMAAGKQGVRPIAIGDYSLVGSQCILLGGCSLPHHSALVAGSTLRDPYEEPYRVYGGINAAELRSLEPELGFFHRRLRE